MPASQPTILATSIGFLPEGPDPANLRPGPSYRLAAELAQAGAHPRLCIIGTATGDDTSRLAAFHNAFSKLGFISSHLTLFPMPNVPDVRAHLLAQDVIWVGGGSTANLLALWRLHGLDVILRECWEAGVVLTGLSAGSLCWHLGGPTDSFSDSLAAFTDGLGFVPFSNGVHDDLDDQPRRRVYREMVADGRLAAGYATEDGVGLHYLGTALHEAVSILPGKRAWRVDPDGTGGYTEQAVVPRLA